MAVDKAKVDAFVEAAKVKARARLDALEPSIVAGFRELMALPPEQRPAATKQRAEETLAGLYGRMPATSAENAAIGRAELRGELAPALGPLDDATLDEIALRVGRAVEEDIRDRARQIQRTVAGTTQSAPQRRPHINI